MTRCQIANGRFIDLYIAAAENPRTDALVNGAQPIGRQSHPFGQGLPRQPDPVARPIDRFLPVKRQVIAILGDDDLRQEARATRLRARSESGSGATIGTASSTPRRTYFGRTVRRRRKRAGS